MATQILLNSILSALMLSLVAIGFNLIFNSTKVFHLAHGAIYVCAVYSFYYFNVLFIQFVFSPLLSFLLSLLFSVVIILFLIIIIEYLVYRPLYLKKANPTISLISSLGIYLVIVNIIAFFFGNESVSINNNFNIILSTKWFNLTDAEILTLSASIFLLAGIYLFCKTNFYFNIRAISDNYSVAEKFGINIQKTRIIALCIGSILSGIAGVLHSYDVAVNPHAGMKVTLTAAVAVIIGGARSIKGTVLACFIIAFIENFSIVILSAQWMELLTYILLIIVVLFYQQGLISVKQRIETR